MKVISVILFILKVTFFGFGGGNAMKPIIRREAVERKKWLTEEEFDKLAITTNLIPGPSVVESLSYISMKILGKRLGAIVAFFAILPHMLLALGLFIMAETFLPEKWMIAINLGVMPGIMGILLSFGMSYYKSSSKQISWIWVFLITFITVLFTVVVPAPYNIPVFVMVGVILLVFVVEYIIQKRKAK